jgi:Zn-dependent metalloprotease
MPYRPRSRGETHGFVPPYLLVRIAQLDDPRFHGAAEAARRSLHRDEPFREARAEEARPAPPPSLRAPQGVTERQGRPYRRVFDAGQEEHLPGRLVREEGSPESPDIVVNEAYDGLGDTYDLYSEVYGRDSIDAAGMPLDATVHYGDRYDNAFWDGEQMVFGDGDGEIFRRFTLSLSVIGHELTHGVIERTADLRYQYQSGALNEHVSDVFGALVEQYARRQRADEASWLIGEGLFTDAVEGDAIRSMRAPGTAYDDDVLGRDPQPAHMDAFIETPDDNGGVHLNSGIPNRAFCETALQLGGNAWERAGQIWYDVLTGGRLSRDAGFTAFAHETARAAAARYGADSGERAAVEHGWTTVGVDAATDGTTIGP